MEQKENFIGQYKFDDFFNKTAAMLKYTWKDSLLLLAIVLLPLTLLSALGINQFIRELEPLLDSAWQGQLELEEFSFTEFMPLFFQIGLWFFLLSLAYWLGDLFINAVISKLVFNKVKGEEQPFSLVTKTVLSNYFGKLVLQSLLLSLIILGIVVAFGLFMVITGVISSLAGNGAVTVLLIVLAYFGLIVLLIWLANRLTFGLQALIFDDLSPSAGLTKSSHLVKSHWWRVWFFLFLGGLIIAFTASMVTGPIIGAFMLPYYASMFESILGDNQDYLGVYKTMASYLPKIWIPILVATLIQSLLQYFILPVFRSLFYIDLKVRKNELNPPGPPPLPEEETRSPSDPDYSPPSPPAGPETDMQS